jgi:hypothetical protein
MSPESQDAARSRPGVLAGSAHFLCQRWPKVLLISVIVITPCLWHRHIEAGDLGSHVYNAWLVHRIQHGQASGLSVAAQWQNILFDSLLSGLGSAYSLSTSEKIAVSLAVLIFFWGTFTLLCAASQRVAWTFLPCVAMLTYSWTFHAGLFNYCISLGLSFFGIAVFWRGSLRERVATLAVAPIILIAHPLGLAALLGIAGFILAVEALPARYHPVLPALAAAVFFIVDLYLSLHYRVLNPGWIEYLINGTDQIVTFGHRYNFLAGATLFFALACLVTDVVRRRREGGAWIHFSLPVYLYLSAQMGILFLPGAIYLPKYGAPLSMLLERLSLVSAVMGCCVLCKVKPQRWHAVGFGAIAAVFFIFLYQDTASLNRMEAQVDRLVQTLPPGQRVLETISAEPSWRACIAAHMLDRACIGHCFAYGNYEPSSNQFRVRAAPGNRIVMTSYEDTESMETGTYTVKPTDLPAYQVYQCSLSVSDLYIRRLGAGETNNRLGMHPEGLPH